MKDKGYKFNFSLPKKDGEKGDDKADNKSDDKAKPKDDADESGEYTKAELGKMVAAAIKTGDGEAIFEAIKKCGSATPSDD